MLEQYLLGELSVEERKFVQESLAWDTEMSERYEELKKSNAEIKRLYPLEKLKRLIQFRASPVPLQQKDLNLQDKPKQTLSYRDKPNTKTFVLGVCAAAVIVCVFVFAFSRLIKSGSNKESGSTATNGAEIETAITADGGKEAASANKPKTAGKSGASAPAPAETDANIMIPPEVAFIYENMFANQELSAVVIPDRVVSIAKNAFGGNPLLSVTIGADVIIAADAFPGNFLSAYNNYGKAAGTYTRPNTNSGAWVRK
jgi:hypothetical protein